MYIWQVNTGTAAILVKVQDVEDQPPEFVVVPAVSRVSEDARIGTSVLQGMSIQVAYINGFVDALIKLLEPSFFMLQSKLWMVIGESTTQYHIPLLVELMVYLKLMPTQELCLLFRNLTEKDLSPIMALLFLKSWYRKLKNDMI